MRRIVPLIQTRSDVSPDYRINHFAVSSNLEEAPFDWLVKAYKDPSRVGTPLDRATMETALSHLLYKEAEEERQEREEGSKKADLVAASRKQEWMRSIQAGISETGWGRGAGSGGKKLP